MEELIAESMEELIAESMAELIAESMEELIAESMEELIAESMAELIEKFKKWKEGMDTTGHQINMKINKYEDKNKCSDCDSVCKKGVVSNSSVNIVCIRGAVTRGVCWSVPDYKCRYCTGEIALLVVNKFCF